MSMYRLNTPTGLLVCASVGQGARARTRGIDAIGMNKNVFMREYCVKIDSRHLASVHMRPSVHPYYCRCFRSQTSPDFSFPSDFRCRIIFLYAVHKLCSV